MTQPDGTLAPVRRVAANAVIVDGDRVLLVKFQTAAGTHYNFPGGGIPIGESLADGLRREVLEETCLDVEIGPLLLIVVHGRRASARRAAALLPLLRPRECG